MSTVEKHSVKEEREKFGATFGIEDYVLVVVSLLVCLSICVYFLVKKMHLFRRSTADAKNEYFLANRSMPILPIAASLMSTFTSGITILSQPAEYYQRGAAAFNIFIPILMMGIVMHFFFLPVFKQFPFSIFEYMDARFNLIVKHYVVLLYLIGIVIFLPFVIETPSLTLEAMTGISRNIWNVAIIVVCTIYTSIGGIRTVVWTDFFQTILTFVSLFIVLIQGSINQGGWTKIFEINRKYEMLSPPPFYFDYMCDMDIYAVFFGGTIMWLEGNAMNQSMIQRYLSLPSLKSALIALWVYIFGIILMYLFCYLLGLILFARFYDCDPITTKLMTKRDQLMAFLVLNTARSVKCLPGMFVSGLLSAALSSLSSSINSFALVVLEDVVSIFRRTPISSTVSQIVVILAGVGLGASILGMIYVFRNIPTTSMYMLALGLLSSKSVPVISITVMGVFCPWIEWIGALTGGFLSMIIMMYLTISAYTTVMQRPRCVKSPKIFGCDYDYGNITIRKPIPRPSFALHHASFWLHIAGCFLVAILVASIVSLIIRYFKSDVKQVEYRFYTPCVRYFCEKIKKEGDGPNVVAEK